MRGLGPIVLHGGRWFGPTGDRPDPPGDRPDPTGDRPDREADEAIGHQLLRLAGAAAARRADSCLPGTDAADPTTRRIAVVQVAAEDDHEAERVAAQVAGYFRSLEATQGTEGAAGTRLRIDTIRLGARSDADSGRWAASIAAADLVYLPSGDAAAIAATLRATLAWNALLAARARGAVLAASGDAATALGAWSPGLGAAGLAALPRVTIVPGARSGDQLVGLRAVVPAEMAILGIAARTALISSDSAAGGREWLVTGEGRAWLLARGGEPASSGPGELLTLPE